MGKRMSSQISRNEMAAVVSLAAAVGIPLMNPDRGLLPGVVIAFVIIVLQIIIAKIAARNEKFEAATQDKLSILVEDGVMSLVNMKKTRITRERLFAQLRSHQKTHLGMVKRMYIEANGLFSLVDEPQPKPGLNIIPDFDEEFIAKMDHQTGKSACGSCGFVDKDFMRKTRIPCKICKKVAWQTAVI